MADETRVWIAQCLCGANRHCIAALAGECDSEAEARTVLATLRKRIADLLRSALNPWCGICGAEESGWRYEVGRTPWRTMEEAGPELLKTAAGNAAFGVLYGSHGPDRPRSS